MIKNNKEIAIDKLKHITNQLCKSFMGYIIDGISRDAPTGEAFITYCSNGAKLEGEKTKFYASETEAVDAYELTLRDIINKGKGILYWRKKPKIFNCLSPSGDPCFRVVSRFLISAKSIDPDCYNEFYAERVKEQLLKFSDIHDSTVG